MRILLTGGAGYIGSHTTLTLLEHGHEIVIVDDLVNSKPSVLDRLEALAATRIPLHVFDLRDEDRLDALFAQERLDAVMHCAGLKAVGDSVTRPLDYYRNHLDSTFSLLTAMARHGVSRLVFSSSATVYGENAPLPCQEDHRPLSATSPYGQTKVMIEQLLTDVAAATDGLKVALLRYFNPVGAHPTGQLGEDPQGTPNNLMPFIAQVAVGRLDRLRIFGADYPTKDGTGERDYIHVMDVATGHLRALEHLDAMPEPARAFNLGTGTATSVLQLLGAFERACGRRLSHEVVPRRPGDVPANLADPRRAHDELGWRAVHGIDRMCADTWRWQSQNPTGYPDR
ncbi:UDP-glucose 4-epimerase GalE [Flexivirga alba]|uniref:UDP-glucose 4-epimerase n=1 Tax=Flexivirga alba TaxID=702742 RepID=A0ABW2ADI5_9MICO